MIINKSELLNDVKEINNNKVGKNDDLINIRYQIACMLLQKSDYDSNEDYFEATNSYFADGENILCFVKRDTVLCSALMNFYAPNGTVRDFENAAKKYVNGFYSNMLANDNEGFFFVASNDYMDALVPYSMQKKFMQSVNPSIMNQIKNNISTKALNKISQLLNNNVKSTDEIKALNQLKTVLSL